MRLFKGKWTAPDGRERTTPKWQVEFRDDQGRRRKIAAFADATASRELGELLEAIADLRSRNMPITGALRDRVERLPARIRAKLAGATKERVVERTDARTGHARYAATPRMTMLDATTYGAGLRLRDLLEEFEQSLLAKGNTAAHALRQKVRARKVLDGIGANAFSDIHALAVERFLRSARERATGRIGIRTSNKMLQATRQFCRWYVRTERAAEDPLRVLQPLNSAVELGRQRRSLTTVELLAILAAAERGKERSGLSGPERALLYTLAVETGLRANELRTLRASSFSLNTNAPTVTVLAANSKRRRQDVLPLRAGTARRLADHLRGHAPFAPAFTLSRRWRSAEMFAFDREAAGVEREDELGRVVDFHALRHTFITKLVEANVNPKLVQQLARHSTITLTLDRYTHLRVEDQRGALDVLPELSPDVVRVTG